MINAILGTKKETTQKFTAEGKRIPVTRIKAGPCVVMQVKTSDKDGYSALQLGWGAKKMSRTTKPQKGHIKGAGLKTAPFYLREIRADETEVEKIKPGETIKVSQVFKAGDEVKVTGVSKGKGFTGVMRRWGFAGGPRTHGQSDRQRAPGSIGQSSQIGRVFKGKKMPGRAGGQKVTVKGLLVMGLDEAKSELWIKGLLPGVEDSLLLVQKTGAVKKFVPLMGKGEKEIKKPKVEKEVAEKKEEQKRPEKEAKNGAN